MSKTVLFQVIQFSISMLFSSIWPIDRTLSGAITPGQSGPGSNGTEGVLCISQSSSITGTLPSDFLVSYSGHLLMGSVPLCRYAVGEFYSLCWFGNIYCWYKCTYIWYCPLYMHMLIYNVDIHTHTYNTDIPTGTYPILMYVHVYTHNVDTHTCSSSSSSCHAASTDIPDPLSPLLPIIHRLWQVFRATSHILT